ncbi:putative Methylase involved in ubiquinone/menaquinone biosynthesis [Mesorhizobium metallidurans STM 2683]|uniref:Putative Methylase involved in ubiquinone/menaquinone biosynthesis n=2 Tax=Mesorhizobium metallidurans TaxID=489722 RepID=M5EFW8_9HYPH|nr:putative Methylase involved in ubiquinone/menaquinone biosynthesis [Mesorhizobium metallidurans STM 2683]
MLSSAEGGRIVEVGAGTGLFTKSLAKVFGPRFTILALEPNEDMRQHAQLQTPIGAPIVYLDGVAEQLPAEDSSARLIAAASAVHRFDRPLFYKEAERMLTRDGLLAFVHYEPDDKTSPFVDNFLSVIERALPSYQRRRSSRPEGGYFDLNIMGELTELPAFENVGRVSFIFSEPIDWETFKNRALSFTIIQKAIHIKGEAEVLSELLNAFELHRNSNGMVRMPYEAEVITARRK